MKSTFRFLFRLGSLLGTLAVLISVNGNAHAGGNRLSNLGAQSSGSAAGTGSNTGPSQTATAATTATSQAVQTSALAQRAQVSLQQSLAALQAQQAAQSAARAAALTMPATVPNGLSAAGVGGLVPLGGIPNSTTISGSVPGSSVSTYVLPASWSSTQVGALTQTVTPVANQTTPETTVTITQIAQQALLNWQTFNIGANTTLKFDQSAGGANVSQWVAINKVAANIAPSQILGSIGAPGQIYVINQNGIIFGGSSQVNVGALVASSLPINDNLIGRGLLNNPDDQFLFSQLNITAGTQGPTPAFAPTSAPTSGTVASVNSAQPVVAGGADGDVIVQPGAQISSPATAENVGGKVALIGPNVANAGTIATPDGQTILAAGNQIAFAAHDSNDPTLRGLDVYVGAVDSSSGTVSNTGLINSPEADITLTGKNVNQNGVINSSTSVSLNGRIDLLADYNSIVSVPSGGSTPVLTPSSTDGVVTLGQGSVTQILPELSSTNTVVGTQLALSSIVNIQGGSISLDQNALLWAPGAATPSNSAQPALGVAGLTLTSGVTLSAGSWLAYNGANSFFNTSGQINLASGATIDASGSENVAASVEENIVSAQLLGTELANSPVQQNGPLRGQTIEIDLRQTGVNADGTTWIGTPLADVSGYVNLVQHTVGELTANGGTVSLSAGQAVNLQAGSAINVSGGWINFQGGLVQTTKVVSGGQILDISEATPNTVYDGIYTGYTSASSKWGVSQTYGNSLANGAQYEAGYIQGGNGGSLAITAPAMTVNGRLYGNTVVGPNQRTPASQLSATYAGASYLPTILATQALPQAGALTLNFQGQNGALSNYPTYSPTPPKIDFGQSQGIGDLVLSPDLINLDGFGIFAINNGDGNITVPATVAMTTSAGGSISLNAANLDIEGSLTAAGGTLTFNVYDYSPYAGVSSPSTGVPLEDNPAIDPTRGSFKLGPTSSLSVAGLVVDDRSASTTAGNLPLVTKGGTITINSFSADLEVGSAINVSGGAEVTGTNKVAYGSGGALSILAGQDPNIVSLVGGNLVFGASLEGYSGVKGGSLTLQAPLIQIGGTATDPDNTLLLSTGFFDKGGFANFTLNGFGEVVPNQADSSLFLPAISIASGASVDPVVQNWVAILNNSGVALTAVTLPLASQRTPVNLTFGAEGVSGFGGGTVVRGDFVEGIGAVIETDPKGSVVISGKTAAVLGSIVAPGGTIKVSGAKRSNGLLFPDSLDPLVTVDLGPNSFLSTRGVVELTHNAYGYITGTVLPGGTISVAGNILAETGVRLDVSGASGVLDVSPTQAGVIGNQLSSLGLVAMRIDSNGGSITLTGGQELVTNATFSGAAGGPSAQGGSLAVSSSLFDPSQGAVAVTPLDATLVVTQSSLNYSASGIGNTVLVNGTTAGLGYFAADSFNTSGFNALTLGGTVQFSGSVTINANSSLAVGSSGIIYADSAVNLVAPYVEVGQAFQGPLTVAQQQLPIFVDSTGNLVKISPAYGTGNITVTASSLIDVGNLSLQNIGNLNLVAANGDIRGDGTLDVAGNIFLTAGQIYPTTETTFTIAAYDHGGIAATVTMVASVSRQLPFSAGGTLNIYASDITQGGVLRAPIGTINLGSGVTSSSPIDPLSGQTFDPTQNLTLASGSTTSVSAVDPMTGQDLTIPYGTLLNGVSWIDPALNDITAAGNGPNAIPGKTINILAANVADQSGAKIDIGGGGDLYAYRFVSGTSGTNDILASTTSFAVLPGYSANYAPFYQANSLTADYNNPTLGIGSQIYLSASSGLPAGVYTLLPARYALLPGAFLVTPASGAPPPTSTAQPDGSTIVSGYRLNGLDQTQTASPLLTSFQIDSQAVVKSRAEYDSYSANTFLSQSAQADNVAVPRLPMDAGQLVLAATQSMTIQGTVTSQVTAGGLGSQVDIASPSDIVIAGPNANLSGVSANTLVLNSSDLSAFGADSLLIGGYRTSTTAGTEVTVTTNNLTVDNAGAALTGPDIILASNESLVLASNADIEQSGKLSSPAQTLLFGNTSTAGSGNGVLVRVSSDISAQIIRSGVDASGGPSLTVGADAKILGTSLILDSTSASALDPTASLSGSAASINSGQISVVLDASQPTSGLVLSSAALAGLQNSAQALSLLSYSSIDIYENGSGSIGTAPDASGEYQVKSLTLDADQIRGFDGGTVTINSQSVTLENTLGGAPPALAGIPASGSLGINAGTVHLGGGSGANALNIDGYANVNFNASEGVVLAATSSTAKDSSGNAISGMSTLATVGALQITTPIITGATGSNVTISADGALTVNPVADGSTATVTGGLGATLNLVGASIIENSLIRLHSGTLNITANAAGANVTVGGILDVSGQAEPYNDLIQYTSGGQISLTSDTGSVILNPGSTIDVAADSAGGNSGSLTVSAATGVFTNNGMLLGQGGFAGWGGTFSLDVASIPGGSLQPLESALDAGGFNQSISIRDRTDAAISIDGTVKAATYNLSADQGSINVTGTIDASNVAATDASGNPIFIGGTIDLSAYGNITLASGSVLTVAAKNFSNAGKGGAVTLEAGSETNGNFSTGALVDIQTGSTIDLSVAANSVASVGAGDFTGTLHIRAPQSADGSDLQVDPIQGSILNASNIVVEGYKLYLPVGGSIDSVEGTAAASTAHDGTVYGDAEGFAANTSKILSRLLTGTPNASQASLFQITPGAEIIGTTGNLTLSNNWDLSKFRFGPNNVAGVLTLRTLGNLIFNGALSDGFTSAAFNATLLAQNTALPLNDQSWSYNLVAGADFSAANGLQVLPSAEVYDPATGLALPGTVGGSLELGKFITQNSGNATSTGGLSAKTSTALSGHFQVIRTGTGNIDIVTAGDVLLQNQFAAIYTAGAKASDIGNFETPILAQSKLTTYGAQYSLAGGDVTISAQGNIARVTNDNGAIVMDSEKELPNNWLYRRGYIDPSTGEFGLTANGDVASTSWWVDFSNFFEGVGTLGGGNVTLTAGHDVSNVDAVAPTNARMTYQTSTGDKLAADQTLVELGGGNVVVQAGNDINGGVYYVERGQGTLDAGNSIITNYTRSPSLGSITVPSTVDNSATWLPTTLFLGTGSFDVSAQNDLLLGPVANPFLLPQGVANTYWDKTYFSTYAATDAVNVASLAGTVTLRESATLISGGTATPLLQNWLQYVDLLTSNPFSVSYYQPWLNITETSVDPFAAVDALLPSTLRVAAFSGDINIVGNLTLAPSPTGTIDLVAAGSINGLQPSGVSTSVVNGVPEVAWASSTLDLSDADPNAIPGIHSPYAYETVVGTSQAAAETTGGSIDVNGIAVPVQLDLSFIGNLFAESGSTEGVYGVLQTKLKLHASVDGKPLHANDPNTVHLYAKNGDISGLTLYSGTSARVVAGQDITDIALYLQNNNLGDISLVAAGRDLIAYDANSTLRQDAQVAGNALESATLAGDIQIAGPGTLEVLAGRNLNLGVGPNNADGTGVGITSIGGSANPTLENLGGSDIFAAAGLGPAGVGFNVNQAGFTAFETQFLNPNGAGIEAALYLPTLAALEGLSSSTDSQTVWNDFLGLTTEKQDQLALDIFYLVLRDAGRDHNTGSGNGYASGYAAIAALFPDKTSRGDISLTSREIKTTNGGNISLLTPEGQLNVGLNVSGIQPVDQGILTEDGGDISIFSNGDVNVGTSRIFTLNGGNEIIWSTNGDIDAGASSKTVQSAPPTRVLVDPQSGAVETDLAGLATGGGIGVLETVAGAPPSDVDLIAPNGTVNAGDAGIRASGNLNIAALRILNAGNIQVGGKSTGLPTVTAPNVAGLAAASSAAGAGAKAANEIARQQQENPTEQGTTSLPSIITVEVLGYGGGDGEDE